jgi:hypothetical protein
MKLTSKYSTYNETVEETSDSVFVASSMEYYGTIPRYSTVEQTYYNNEGTGENHDEQYLLYKEEGLCWDDETNMEKTFPDDLSENTGVYFTKTIDGELPQDISTEDWTVSLVRSQTYHFQFYTWGIEDDGFSSSQISYENYCAVTPCFCL